MNRKKFDIFGEIWLFDDYIYKKHILSQNGDQPLPEPDGYPVPYPVRGTFERSKEEGLFSAFRIGGNFWPDNFKLKALNPDAQLIQIDMLRCTTDYRRPENAALQLSYEDFAEHYCNAAIDFALAHPGRVLLCAVGEIDSSHPWPQDHSSAPGKRHTNSSNTTAFIRKSVPAIRIRCTVIWKNADCLRNR